jgi:hypothetical protein
MMAATRPRKENIMVRIRDVLSISVDIHHGLCKKKKKGSASSSKDISTKTAGDHEPQVKLNWNNSSYEESRSSAARKKVIHACTPVIIKIVTMIDKNLIVLKGL